MSHLGYNGSRAGAFILTNIAKALEQTGQLVVHEEEHESVVDD